MCAPSEGSSNFTVQQGGAAAGWERQEPLTMSVIIAAQLKMDTGAASRRVSPPSPPGVHV